MDEYVHRPCRSWFVLLNVRLTKPPQIAAAQRAGGAPRPWGARGRRPPPPCGDWCRFRAAGSGLGAPAICRCAGAARTKKHVSCSKNAVWERARGPGRRGGSAARPRAGKTSLRPFGRAPLGRRASSNSPRSTPFPSRIAIFERERKNGCCPALPGRRRGRRGRRSGRASPRRAPEGRMPDSIPPAGGRSARPAAAGGWRIRRIWHLENGNGSVLVKKTTLAKRRGQKIHFGEDGQRSSRKDS